MSVSELFHLFVARHIVTGATGLLAFRGAVFAKKGRAAHRTVGKVFTVTMLLTGTAAIGTHLWFLYERQPALWAIPLTVGLVIILYQWRKLARPRAALPAGQRA